ncbi:hypothetical protein PPERSA_04775 [Pseudocohnilembus persalinus]|uniref:DEUBAD domain-containing protein n=1 Tax=Pseudocohnilembus persalinus TaxID=266149 RepID=A0A0V0QNH1_PSEPJ|nr:hypothetical protein PPERSA_04775 [Pseudocohnilembus persalinus]|eukprot:KRX03897.1 hypothetical protein PPERSA_04775 [Pseudocohnilembus persalinus]
MNPIKQGHNLFKADYDGQLQVYYKDEKIQIPKEILELENMQDLFDSEILKQCLNKEEISHLNKFLPEQDSSKEETLEKLLKGDDFFFGNPLQNFLENLKKGYFTKLKQREDKLSYEILKIQQLKYYEDLINDLEQNNQEKYLNRLKLRSLKRRAQYVLNEAHLSDDSAFSQQSIQNLRVDNAFSDLSKGHSTDESEQGDLKERKADNDKLEKLLEQKQNTSEKIELSEIPLSYQNTAKQIQKKYKDDYYRNKLLEMQRTQKENNLNSENKVHSQTNTENNNNQNQKSNNNNNNGTPLKDGEQRSQLGINNNKNNGEIQQTVPKSKKELLAAEPSPYRLPSTPEWIENYRNQEKERYKHPTRPWTFTLQNGQKVCVGPVAKKIQVSIASKPREHPLLKNDRFPYVTILCLVKDAAAKLPQGIGTRLDICELLKESQYVYDDLPIEKVNNIVSGALDRLHYTSDPCVKYDLERKLWMYIHKNRTEDYPEWQDGDENLKLESTKTKKKKKLVMGEQARELTFQIQKQRGLQNQSSTNSNNNY